MRRLLFCAAVAMLSACGPSQPSSVHSESTASMTSAASHEDAEAQAEAAALPAPYNTANYEAGRRTFAQCTSCHTIAAGAPNRIGPHLHGVLGRQVASVEGFAYSQALQAQDFTWDAEHLDQWLKSPAQFVPNNRMGFGGVPNDAQRRDLIAYLMVASAED